jgi:hypothetical protein
MKAQIRGKTRNRGRDWADFRHPDEKNATGGLVGTMAGDALTHQSVHPARDTLDDLRDRARARPYPPRLARLPRPRLVGSPRPRSCPARPKAVCVPGLWSLLLC